MAETGRTDSVFWPVGSGRTADLGKETGKQRDGGSGSVLEYWNRQPQRYRAVLWKAEKEEQVQMLERREEYLRQIAASLGISSQILVYRTYGEDSQSVVLQKKEQTPILCCVLSPGEKKGRSPDRACMQT